MEEFSALAARVAASVVELRGCLSPVQGRLGPWSLSGGGRGPRQSGLAAAPQSSGDPEKGFLEFGDEIWTYVRRGPYAAFAVSGLGVRPGLLIDQLDQMLYTAEEVRARREALEVAGGHARAERKATNVSPSGGSAVGAHAGLFFF